MFISVTHSLVKVSRDDIAQVRSSVTYGQPFDDGTNNFRYNLDVGDTIVSDDF